jgi:hypothetical protein
METVLQYSPPSKCGLATAGSGFEVNTLRITLCRQNNGVQQSAVDSICCKRTRRRGVVQCSEVEYSAVQCSTVQCGAMQCSAVQCSAVQGVVVLERGFLFCFSCTALHYTELHCTTLHYTALHCTALHCTALHCTVFCSSCTRCF